ncbi:uncharacterized protein [Palaemon carinicauda]|uniref:uncharacterized protein n=1 Tax=Palaemon carinicauda TaxID=392227 RepID=UPI0035B67285
MKEGPFQRILSLVTTTMNRCTKIFTFDMVEDKIYSEDLPMMSKNETNGIAGSMTNSTSEDCLGCRLVSGGGLMGVSLYVGYHAAKNTHPIGRTVTFLFAGALGGVGLTRLLKLPPFDNPQKNAVS